MSLNNSNKSSNSIGIPSIYFKNKSILNFNQLSTIPKSKNLPVSNNMCKSINLSLYNEKANHIIKRTVLTNPTYTENQKIHAFKIIESKKRKINCSEINIKKKSCLDKNVVASSSGNFSDIDCMNDNALIPKCKELKHLTSRNCIKNIDKDFNSQDKNLIHEESSIRKTIIDKDKCLLQDNSMEMSSETSILQKNDNKIIHLNLFDAAQQPNNNYKAKSISQFITQIDNHRLSCSKKRKSDCMILNKRFENIKAFLSSDSNRSDNRNSFILSNYSSQANNSNPNPAIVLNESPKVKIFDFKDDSGKDHIFQEKLNENVSKIINTTHLNSAINLEKIDKNNEKNSNPDKLQNSLLFKDLPSLSSINETTISSRILKDYDNIGFDTREKENNESKSTLSINNEENFTSLESGSSKFNIQSKCPDFVRSFGKTSNEEIILPNNQHESITTDSFGKTDSSRLVSFSPMPSFLKSSVFSNIQNDSSVIHHDSSFSLSNNNHSLTTSSTAPKSSNGFSFVTNNSNLFEKSSIFNSRSSLTNMSSGIFNGNSNNNLFNKSSSSNDQQLINQQSTISVSNTVPAIGLFNQPQLSSPKIDYSNTLKSSQSNGLFKTVFSESPSFKLNENKPNLFDNKSNQSNTDNSFHKTDVQSTSSNLFSFGINTTSNSLTNKSNVHQDDNSRQSNLSSNQANTINSLSFTSASTNNFIPVNDNLQKTNSNQSLAFPTLGFSFSQFNGTNNFGNAINSMNHQQNDIEKSKINSNTLSFGKNISNDKVFPNYNNTCETTSFLRNNITVSNTFPQNSVAIHPFNFGNTK